MLWHVFRWLRTIGVFIDRVRVSKAAAACAEQQAECYEIDEEEIKHVGCNSSRDRPNDASNVEEKGFNHGEDVAEDEADHGEWYPDLDTLQSR